MHETIFNMNKELQNDKITIIAKVTKKCNLNCPYCYSKKDNKDLSREDLLSIAEKAFREYANVEIIFHGGEPLLREISWYEAVLKELTYMKRVYNVRLRLALQSNGTLLTDEFIELFKKYNIQIGFSFDGRTNELTRKNSGKIIKNINRAKKAGVGRGAIMLIHSENVENLIEEYKFFNIIDIKPKFNIMYKTHLNDNDLFNDLETEKLINGICNFFNFYINKKNPGFQVQMLDPFVLAAAKKKKSTSCSHINCLTKWISIHPNGELYPCGKYWPEEFNLGNINDHNSIKDVYTSKKYKEIIESEKERLSGCKSCKLFEHCQGGCPNISIANNDSLSELNKERCLIFAKVTMHIFNYMKENKIENEHIKNLIK